MGLSSSRYSLLSNSPMTAPAKEKEVPERRDGGGGGGGVRQPRARKKTRETVNMVPLTRQRKREKGNDEKVTVVQSKKKARTIASCTSPRPIAISFLAPHSSFNWYEMDTWTEVAKYLDGKSMVSLGLTNRWFHRLIMDDSIWRYASLRDLQVPLPQRPSSFNWAQLYASAFDGSHSYKFRQQEKHIDWMRIGAFFFDSPVALLTETLVLPRKLPPRAQNPEKAIKDFGAFAFANIRPGIWIADLQLVRCPVCNLNTCEGTMQVLDARHVELFLEEGYKNGSWDYAEVAAHKIEKQTSAAAGAIFDVKHVYSTSSAGVLDLKSWVGQPEDWQPKARVGLHAVAVNTNLQPNEGLHVRFQVMRSGAADGEVVSIRISQQLV